MNILNALLLVLSLFALVGTGEAAPSGKDKKCKDGHIKLGEDCVPFIIG